MKNGWVVLAVATLVLLACLLLLLAEAAGNGF